MKLLSTFSVFLLSLLGDVSAQEIAVRNQLIPLKLKKLQRGDRLPPVSEKKSGLFQLPFQKRLPDTRADEAWQEEQFSGLALAHMERLVSVKQAGEMGELLEEGFESSSFGQEKPDDKIVASMSPDSLVAGLKSLGKLKFKTLSASGLKTVFHVEANRDGAEYMATWECSWVKDEDSLKLARLQIGKSETAYSKGAWFIDGTEAVIGKNPRFQPQVMRGIEYWAERVTRIGDLSMVGHHGITVSRWAM